MANGKIRFGKQSGGELALVIPDGVSNTEVIVPESGILATEQYVDNKYSGFKNYIINGRFDIWQRGTSVNIAGGEVRCTDMFLAYSTATTPTASRDTGAAGFYNSLKISGANSLSNKHIIHKIEASNAISLGASGNTKITFSLWLKADVNSTVKVAIRVPNIADTWGSYTTPKTSNDIQITTSWDRYSVTFDLDFIYWGGIALDVTTTTAQTSLWTTGWQLEQGSVATPFENRPIGLELSLCQRYYQVSIELTYMGNTTAGWSYGTTINLPTLMRTTPTATFMTNRNLSAFQQPTVIILDASRIGISGVAASTGGGAYASLYALSAEL